MHKLSADRAASVVFGLRVINSFLAGTRLSSDTLTFVIPAYFNGNNLRLRSVPLVVKPISLNSGLSPLTISTIS